MKNIKKSLIISGLILIFATVATALILKYLPTAKQISPEQPSTENAATQNSAIPKLQKSEVKTDSQNEVTVSAQFSETDKNTIFKIAFSTHSVDLENFDPQKQIYIETANGKTIFPQKIEQNGSGHHQDFIVSFTKIDKPVKLVVANIAGIKKREFVWTK